MKSSETWVVIFTFSDNLHVFFKLKHQNFRFQKKKKRERGELKKGELFTKHNHIHAVQ